MNTLQQLLDRPDILPGLPRVIRELTQRLDAEEVDLDGVVRLISGEPGLTLRVLRLANSAYYGRRRSVDSVHDGVLLIGLAALKVLVLGSAIGAAVPIPPGLSRSSYWRHCLNTAAGARYFATHAQIDPQAAFAAGLVHEVGEPILRRLHGGAVEDLDQRLPFFDEDRDHQERRRLGLGYAEVGALLAERWQLPAAVVDAIRDAPEPMRAGPFSPLAGCIYLARQIASGAERKQPLQDTCATLDARVLDQLRLSADVAFAMPPLPRLTQGLEQLFS